MKTEQPEDCLYNKSIINEKLIKNNPIPISLEKTEIIISQLKNSICNINLGSKGRGTGFFTKIKFPDQEHLLPVLIACNHVIDESFFSEKEEINIEINNKAKTIDLKNRITYTCKESDITIIEINEQKDEIKDFLILDENNYDNKIEGNTVYILQYFQENIYNQPVPSVSYGVIKDLEKSKIINNCSTTEGSSGSPILNLVNNKVIGIHEGTFSYKNNNYGILLNNTINDFIKKKYNNKFEDNLTKYLVNAPPKKVHIEDLKISKNNNIIDIENLSNTDNIIFEKKIMNEYAINNIFINIRILNLTCNNISDIRSLVKVKFEKLEKLYLDNNKISDINILKEVRFKELKELYLNGNNISDIEILEKVNFPNLEIFDLSSNKITKIDVFEKVNFAKLQKLSLYRNKISNIDKIKYAKFKDLELLAISHNKTININSLKDVKFKNLNCLFLADINLKTIDIFSSIDFKHLKLLCLGGNNISNIKGLSRIDYKELEYITLYDNYISDIEVLAEVNFPKLKSLNLASNLITNIEVFKNVNFPELNELNLQQNNIVEIKVFKNCKMKKLFKLNIQMNKIDIKKNIDIINELKSSLKLFK